MWRTHPQMIWNTSHLFWMAPWWGRSPDQSDQLSGPPLFYSGTERQICPAPLCWCSTAWLHSQLISIHKCKDQVLILAWDLSKRKSHAYLWCPCGSHERHLSAHRPPLSPEGWRHPSSLLLSCLVCEEPTLSEKMFKNSYCWGKYSMLGRWIREMTSFVFQTYPTHALHSPCHYYGGLSGLDGLSSQTDRLQTRATHHLAAPGRNRVWDSCSNTRLTCRVLSIAWIKIKEAT